MHKDQAMEIRCSDSVSPDYLVLSDASYELPDKATLLKVLFKVSQPATFLVPCPQISLLREVHKLQSSKKDEMNMQINAVPWIKADDIVQCTAKAVNLCKANSVKSLKVTVKFVGLLNSTMRSEYLSWNYLLLAKKVPMADLIKKRLSETKWVCEGMYLWINAQANKCAFVVTEVTVNDVMRFSNAALRVCAEAVPIKVDIESPELFSFSLKERQILPLFYSARFFSNVPVEVYQEFNHSIFSEYSSNSNVLYNVINSFENSSTAPVRKLLYSNSLLSPLIAILCNDPRFALLYLSSVFLESVRNLNPLYIDCNQFLYFHEKSSLYRESDLASHNEKANDFSILLSEVANYISELPVIPTILIIDNISHLPHQLLVSLSIWLKTIFTKLHKTETYAILIAEPENKDKIRTVQSVIDISCTEIMLNSTDRGVKDAFAKSALEEISLKNVPDQDKAKGQILRVINNECAGVETAELIKLFEKMLVNSS